MSAVTDPVQDLEPTDTRPDEGVIFYGDTRQPISRVLHWVDDGEHVFRSLEYDVIASDPDLQEAVNQFVATSEDYMHLLAEIDSEEMTEDEQRVFILLAERFIEANQRLRDEEEQRRRRLVSIQIGWRRRVTRGNWSPRSGAASETSPSPSLAC